MKETNKVYHYDIFGKRSVKYSFLFDNSINSIEWNLIKPKNPNYFFIPKDYSKESNYEKGIKVSELFPVQTSGIKTHRDGLVVDIDLIVLKNRITDFYDPAISNSDILSKYKIKEKEDWLTKKRKAVVKSDLFTS